MANNIIAAITITSDSSTLQTHALFKDLHPTASHFDTLTMLVAGVIFIWICNRKYHFWWKDLFMEKDPKGKQRNVKCYFFLKTSAFPC